ncbi:MAG: TonB-dependent receptor, partial [Cyclobacteriaceae bacterium]
REQEIIKSRQFLLGAVHQSQNWIFEVDVYYKEVDNITTNGTVVPGLNVPSRLLGSIRARGMDFLVKRRIKAFDIWANYTLSKTDMNFPRLKTEDFPANYDQRHIVNISGSYQKNRFRGSVGWIWSSGVPNYLDDPFFPATGPKVEELPEPGAVGEVERFGSIHQLDASVAYHFFTKDKKAKITVGLSFLNIYDNENLLETVNVRNGQGSDGFTPANRYTIGFAPDFMLKVEW